MFAVLCLKNVQNSFLTSQVFSLSAKSGQHDKNPFCFFLTSFPLSLRLSQLLAEGLAVQKVPQLCTQTQSE